MPSLDKSRESDPQDQYLHFSPSADDLNNAALPSPPYRRDPSSSNLHLHNIPGLSPYAIHDQESPAYASRSTVMVNEKSHFVKDEPPLKPSVHYPEDVRGQAPGYFREDSIAMLSSRPASIATTDDEFDEDEFDWSGDEDLRDQQQDYQRRIGNKPKPKGWGFKRIITFLFSSLIGSTLLAGVLVAPALLVHFYWYLPSRSERRQYINQNIQAWLFWAAANLLISWYLALLIDILPSIFTALISGAWGHVSEKVKSKVELYNSVKNTVKPLFYAASAWASWVIIFGGIYKLYNEDDPRNSRASYTYRVSQVVAFGFFFTLMVCIQRMLSHAIAFSFHRTAYQERLDAVQTALSVVETLRNYRPKATPSSSAPRSGTRTPVLGALGMSTLGFGALGFGRRSRRGSDAPVDVQERYSPKAAKQRSTGGDATQYDGDTEEWGDNDGTVVGTNGKSTYGKGKFRLGSAPVVESPGVVSEQASRPGTPSGLRNSTIISRETSQAALNSYFASAPDSGDSPHRYPPTPLGMPAPMNVGLGSPRESLDSGRNVAGAVEAVTEAVERTAKVIKSAVLHDARNIKGKEGTEDEADTLAWYAANTKEAKRLARAIYLRFKDRRRNYLLPEDFYPAFPTSAEAEAAFRVFDKDNNGDISRAEIKSTLVKVYKERRFLSRSMRDVGAALKTLDHILLFFAMVVLLFISLSVFGVEVGDSLTSLYSLAIAASFVFKNAASEAFDAIMFLFVTHPYDTGDRVFIGEENLVVKKMGLFATVFARSDGTETYYFNSQLFSQFITNVRRSGKTFENLTMQLEWRTPLVKLDALEKSLNEWLATEENRWFEPSTSVVLQHIEYQRFLEVTIGIGHNGTWQDWGLRNARKTAFHAAVNYYCKQLGIVCHASPLPISFGEMQTGDGADNNEGQYPDEGASTTGGGGAARGQGEGREEGSGVFEERRGYEEAMGLPPSRASESHEKMKPTLGFLPPESARTSHLRARKSKSKKAMMRGDY
ncbi:EF-hand domain-containing protein [Pleurotus pulmonarius]